MADRYEVVSSIGKGGMGEVFVARDRRLRRRVALKTIPSSGGNGSHGAERLRAEAEVLAQLEHPAIVAVHDVIEEHGRVHLVMELIDGVSLRTKLEGGPLPPPRVAEIVSSVASALGAAHTRDLVHRDVKPDNIMIRPDGRAALLDFGIAKAVDGGVTGRTLPAAGMTESGAIVGTPLYLAPEQACGEPVSAATDQFSLAVTAYEMLAGSSPWPTEGGPRLIAAILQGRPSPIATQLGLGEAVDDILARAMSKEPSARFATAQAFADALADAIAPGPLPRPSSQAVDVRQSGAAVELRQPSTRRRIPAGAMFVAATMIIVSAGLAGRHLLDQDRPPAPIPSMTAPPFASTSFRLEDLPPSRTNSPDARAIYRKAIRLLGQGEITAGNAALDQVLAADPDFASAHLQRLVEETYRCPTNLAVARPRYEGALRGRATLSARDQDVLEALEPTILDPPNLVDAAARMRALATKRPDDAQIADMLGVAENKLFHFEASAEAIRRGIALDGTDALPGFLVLAQDVGGADADAVLDECLRRGPQAEWCRSQRALDWATDGACSEHEGEARTLSVMIPESPYGPWHLTDALAGEGASVEAIRVAGAQWLELVPSTGRSARKAAFDQALALWSGDFAGGVAGADAPPIASSPTAIVARVEGLWEMGARREAGEVALGYVKRAPALPRFERPETDPLPHMLARAHASGVLSDREFELQRQAWIDAWRRRLDDVGWRWAAPVVWALAYAGAETPDAARAALERAVPFGGPPPMANRKFWALEDGPVGELLLLAGRLDDAIPRLRSGARRCELSMAPLQAQLHLGEALERTGDRTGACASYEAVTKRWGGAKPRSVTADLARERTRILRCTGE